MRHRKAKIPILVYHQVSELSERTKIIRSTNPAYSLSIQQFSVQMQHLSENGYRTLCLNELIDYTPNRHQKGVVITFDDGWANNYANVFPILNKMSMTGTIFVITGFVGKDKYMAWNQLREMSKEGISIQSHTVSHRPLPLLNVSEIMQELYQSKKSIEAHLGLAVDFLSVPHGMISQEVIDVARNVGYRAICTMEPGFSHTYTMPAIFKRINISDQCNLGTFEKIVQANYVAILPAIISKKIKNFTKKLLGYNNYRRIYHLRYRIEE